MRALSEQQDMVDAFGISTDGRRNRANQRLNAISIALPLLGTLSAFGLLPWYVPSALTWILFVIFLLLNGIGGGIGLHRYFTHRAFRTSRAFAFLLGIFGSWSWQGPISRWVADHRRHHRFTDQPRDPHSPYWVDGAPAGSRFHGWQHSHFTWMLTGAVSDQNRYAPDTLTDPAARWCTRHYWALAWSSLLLPALIALMVSGRWREAVLALLWAGCVRVSLLHQLTWSVNSIGHMFGHKVDGAKDESRNLAPLALLLFGEGLHSYHHRWPTTAINRPLGLDVMGCVILLLQKFGVVWDVRDPGRKASSNK